MLDAPVESDRTPTNAGRGPLPMRGAILAAVANAFRLGDKVRARPSSFSTGTAKRILQDEPAVRDETRTALTRALVGSLFSIDYLTARGLDEGEAHIHDETLVAAIEDLLDRWETIARQLNCVAQPRLTMEELLLASGLDVDIIARSAAYLCMYSRLHPVLDSLERWISEPGLSGAFAELMARAGHQISLERLGKDAGLQKNTLKNLRDGRGAEPQGETLEQLAHAFAKHGVARRDREGDASAAEIEVELRVAAALGRVRDALSNERFRAAMSVYVPLLRQLRSELRRYKREELATLVVTGDASPLWPALKGMIAACGQAHMMQFHNAMAAKAEQDLRRFQDDPVAAMKQWAARMTEDAEAFRSSWASLRTEDEDAENPVLDLLDDMAGLMRSVAYASSGEEGAAAPYQPKASSDALEAEAHAMNAIAPWNAHGPEQRLWLLRQAVAACPSSIRPRFMLADELISQGRHDEALAHYHALVGERPDSAQARYGLALQLACMDQYRESLAELDELARRGQSTADAEALRGECLLELGFVEAASEAFERALRSNDRLVPALRGLARCCRSAGDERKARELERRATYYGETGGGRGGRRGV